MQKEANISFKDNKLFLQGELNFSNVMFVYEKSLPTLTSSPQYIIDFSELKSTDSSGLALITEWIKLAKKHHKRIQFLHLPNDLLLIAKAAGMEQILMKDNSVIATK